MHADHLTRSFIDFTRVPRRLIACRTTNCQRCGSSSGPIALRSPMTSSWPTATDGYVFTACPHPSAIPKPNPSTTSCSIATTPSWTNCSTTEKSGSSPPTGPTRANPGAVRTTRTLEPRRRTLDVPAHRRGRNRSGLHQLHPPLRQVPALATRPHERTAPRRRRRRHRRHDDHQPCLRPRTSPVRRRRRHPTAHNRRTRRPQTPPRRLALRTPFRLLSIRTSALRRPHRATHAHAASRSTADGQALVPMTSTPTTPARGNCRQRSTRANRQEPDELCRALDRG